MTRDQFDGAICRLSLLRGAPDDGDVHFAALKDIPADVFDAACEHALRTRTFFPVPAELRMDADATRRRPSFSEPERAPVYLAPVTHVIKNPFGGKDVTVIVDRDWKRDCDRCSDIGMRSWWCGAEPSRRFPDSPVQMCGRRGEHPAHEWVDRCDCVSWNPTIRRARAAQDTKYAHEPEKVRS